MVFIVTGGTYDDYHIIGAYSKIGDAREKFRSIGSGTFIEVWDGDTLVRNLSCVTPEEFDYSVILEDFDRVETPFGTIVYHKGIPVASTFAEGK